MSNFLVGLLCGVVCGMAIMFYFEILPMQDEAIKRGLAEWDVKMKEDYRTFKWKEPKP